MPEAPTFPVPSLVVRPWEDAVIDELGHDPRSLYVERFWLGILGPSATWFLRRLAQGLEAAPEGFVLDLPATALELGLGGRSGRHATFVRTIERCCRFGATDARDDQTLLVRRKIAPLTRAQVERLPPHLQEEHRGWREHPGYGGPIVVEQLRKRAQQLALSLLQLGEDGESTERQLHRWRIHPSIAHEAVGWAVARHRELLAAGEPSAATGTAGTVTQLPAPAPMPRPEDPFDAA